MRHLSILCAFLPALALGQFGANCGLLTDVFMLKGSQASIGGSTHETINDAYGWEAGLMATINAGQDSTALLISMNYREIQFHTDGYYQAGPYLGHHSYFVRTSHLVLGVVLDEGIGGQWSFRPGLQLGFPLGARITGYEYQEGYQAVLEDREVDEHDQGDPYSLLDARLHAHFAWHTNRGLRAGSFVDFGPSYGLDSYVEGNWERLRTLRFEVGYGVWLKPFRR